MKSPLIITLLSILMMSFLSCKKDVKDERTDTVQTIPISDTTRLRLEENVKERVVDQKKNKSEKKKASIKKDSKKNSAVLHIPGTFETTENSFSKKYVKDYEEYVTNYKKAVNAKDMDSFLKLSKASNDLSKQYNRLMNILPGEEIEKLSEYMQIKSKELAELSKQM